ncbi:hypothetical protein L484_026677 [Morus notabilis]|uniref:Uncharacterized protein n=1 Tax=Morus notabilis TaxID=981085 RepID=W9SN00_9ROSA|nr:hypothetical protein L484_026677 [Morus notabilis]
MEGMPIYSTRRRPLEVMVASYIRNPTSFNLRHYSSAVTEAKQPLLNWKNKAAKPRPRGAGLSKKHSCPQDVHESFESSPNFDLGFAPPARA